MEEKVKKRVGGIITFVLLLGGLGILAQQAMKSTEPSEVQTLKLIVALQNALASQTDFLGSGCRDKQVKFDTNYAEYKRVEAEVVKEMGLPEGTTFNVDAVKKTATKVDPKKGK